MHCLNTLFSKVRLCVRPSSPISRRLHNKLHRNNPSSGLGLPVLLVASTVLTPFCRLRFGVDMSDRLAYLVEPRALHH